MKYNEKIIFSNKLDRYMSIKIYGYYGPSFIVFPCQDKASDDFYLNGMIDYLSDYIENGRMKLFCVDSNDYETVSSNSLDYEQRALNLEHYHEFIINEVLPIVYEDNKSKCLPYLLGLSMGATHASINFFRRPELFKGIIAISGNYDLSKMLDNYMSPLVYDNSPIHFLRNMPTNHPYIKKYNSKRMVFVVGKGRFEFLVYEDNEILNSILKEKNINAWFDFWSEEFGHDWEFWKIELRHYLDLII